MATNFLNSPANAKPSLTQGGNSYKPPAPQPAGMVQNDGNVTAAPVRPTRSGTIQGQASPAKYNTSGIERAMGTLADQKHPRRK